VICLRAIRVKVINTHDFVAYNDTTYFTATWKIPETVLTKIRYSQLCRWDVSIELEFVCWNVFPYSFSQVYMISYTPIVRSRLFCLESKCQSNCRPIIMLVYEHVYSHAWIQEVAHFEDFDGLWRSCVCDCALILAQVLELFFEWVRVFLVHPDESLRQLQTQLSVRCHRDRHCGTCTYRRCFKTPYEHEHWRCLRKILWVREMGVYVGWGIYSLFRNKCSQKNRNTHTYTNTNTLRIMVKK